MAILVLNNSVKKKISKSGKPRTVGYSLVSCESEYHVGTREREITKLLAKRGIGVIKCGSCCKKGKISGRRKCEKDYQELAKLKEIEFLGPVPPTVSIRTNWKCKCGNEFKTNFTAIQCGHCRCQKCLIKSITVRNSHGGYKEISGSRWSSIWRNAITRKIDFSLTIEQIYDLFIKQDKKCKLSGRELILDEVGEKRKFNTAALDRINSSKGYSIDNVQWLHKDLNWMKGAYDEKYFVQFCKNVAFYNKKTWVITGALGYIGFEICRLLKNTTDIVIAIDNNIVEDRILELKNWNIQFYNKDIFDSKELLISADYCVHCAGITDVPCIKSQETIEKNNLITKVGTDGTREILKHLPEKCKIIFLSTHVIFENLKEKVENIKEDFIPCPNLAYSTSKYQSEQDLINSGRNFIILRLGSVYGLPATRWRIVANLFAKLTAEKGEIKLFGANCIKPSVGILDVARCIIFFAENNYNKEIINLVNENIMVKDIAQICKDYSYWLKIEEISGETPNLGYSLSNEKLLNTGFKFQQNIRTEIEKMIEYWRHDSLCVIHQ